MFWSVVRKAFGSWFEDSRGGIRHKVFDWLPSLFPGCVVVFACGGMRCSEEMITFLSSPLTLLLILLFFPHIKSNSSLCTAKHFLGRDLKVRRRLSVEAEKKNEIKGVSKDNPLSSFSTRSCVIHIIHMVKADLLFKQQEKMLLSICSDSNVSSVRPFLKDLYKENKKKTVIIFSPTCRRHFVSFTAKPCASILLKNRSRWRLVLRHIKTRREKKQKKTVVPYSPLNSCNGSMQLFQHNPEVWKDATCIQNLNCGCFVKSSSMYPFWSGRTGSIVQPVMPFHIHLRLCGSPFYVFFLFVFKFKNYFSTSVSLRAVLLSSSKNVLWIMIFSLTWVGRHKIFIFGWTFP